MKVYGFRWQLTPQSQKIAQAVVDLLGKGEVKVLPETEEVLVVIPMPDKRHRIDIRALYSAAGFPMAEATSLVPHPFICPFFCTVKEVEPFIVEIIPDEEIVEEVKVIEVGDAGQGVEGSE